MFMNHQHFDHNLHFIIHSSKNEFVKIAPFANPLSFDTSSRHLSSPYKKTSNQNYSLQILINERKQEWIQDLTRVVEMPKENSKLVDDRNTR